MCDPRVVNFLPLMENTSTFEADGSPRFRYRRIRPPLGPGHATPLSLSNVFQMISFCSLSYYSPGIRRWVETGNPHPSHSPNHDEICLNAIRTENKSTINIKPIVYF